MSVRSYGLLYSLHKTLMNYNASALTRAGSDTLFVARYFLLQSSECGVLHMSVFDSLEVLSSRV